MTFALSALGRAGFDTAAAAFYGDALERLSATDRASVEDDAFCSAGLQTFLALDYRTVDGDTMAERFLRRKGDRLAIGERRYLERFRRSRMGLFEIRDVRLDAGLLLVDLLTGEHVEVRERRLTRQVIRYDVLAIRLVLGPSDELEIDGAVHVFSQDDAAHATHLLRSCTGLPSGDGVADKLESRKADIAAELARFYIATYYGRPGPQAFTAEGHTFAPTTTRFRIVRPGVAAALAADPRFVRLRRGFLEWVDIEREDLPSLASIATTRSSLTIETMTRERADEARVLLEALLGTSIRHEATETTTLEEALAARPVFDDEVPSVETIPLEMRRAVKDSLYSQHYATWLDIALPALDGASPREAATRPELRPRVAGLIKDLERSLDRERRAGEASYSAAWMWAELQLDPDESLPTARSDA